MDTVTVKVDDKLKRRMSGAIRRRIELEERRRAAERLLEGLRVRKHVVPKGFINETIREMRKAR